MKTIHVAAAVIVENHKIFAARRGYGEFKGYWVFAQICYLLNNLSIAREHERT